MQDGKLVNLKRNGCELMANNNQARHLEILAAAHALLDEQNIDVSEGVELRPLANILKKRGVCDYDTAKRNLGKAVRQKRGQLVAQWGGAREGAGYPKGQPRKPPPD